MSNLVIAAFEPLDQCWEGRRGKRRRPKLVQGVRQRIPYARTVLTLNGLEDAWDPPIEIALKDSQSFDGCRPDAGGLVRQIRGQRGWRPVRHFASRRTQRAECCYADLCIPIADRLRKSNEHAFEIDHSGRPFQRDYGLQDPRGSDPYDRNRIF